MRNMLLIIISFLKDAYTTIDSRIYESLQYIKFKLYARFLKVSLYILNIAFKFLFK